MWSDPATYEKIKSACGRVFKNKTDAEECGDCVMEMLSADNNRRIRAFKGQSKFSTFLYSVINHLAADCHRKKYGRRRIPKPVDRLGLWAQETYRMVCWNRCSLADAYEICFAKGIIHMSYPDFLKKSEALKSIKCRKNPLVFPWTTPGKARWNHPQPRGIIKIPWKVFWTNWIGMTENRRDRHSGNHDGLSESDRLFIKLVYGRNQSVAAAGQALGMKDHQARRRLQKLLTGFRKNLLAKGIRE